MSSTKFGFSCSLSMMLSLPIMTIVFAILQAQAKPLRLPQMWPLPVIISPVNGAKNVSPWPVAVSFTIRFPQEESEWVVEFSTSKKEIEDSAGPFLKRQIITSVINPMELPQGGISRIATGAAFPAQLNTTYYWHYRTTKLLGNCSARIAIGSPCATKTWSPIYEFETDGRVPTITTPITGSNIPPWKAPVKWSFVEGATQYEFRIEFARTIQTKIVSADNVATIFDFHAATNYLLQIRSINGSTKSAWSPSVTFKTTKPTVQLLSPSDMSTVYPWNIALTWSPTPGAVRYFVETSSDNKAWAALWSGANPTTTVSVAPMQSLYWRVTPAGDEFDPGPVTRNKGLDMGIVSSTRSLTGNYALVVPSPNAPVEGAWVEYRAPVKFGWAPTPGTSKYDVIVKEKQGVPREFLVEGTSTYSVPDVSTNPVGYCWQVKAIGPLGYMSQASAQRCYAINAARPTILSPPYNSLTQTHVVLTWQDVYAPDGYVVDMIRIDNNSYILNKSPTSQTSLSVDLAPGKYSWTVYAVGHPNMSPATPGLFSIPQPFNPGNPGNPGNPTGHCGQLGQSCCNQTDTFPGTCVGLGVMCCHLSRFCLKVGQCPY